MRKLLLLAGVAVMGSGATCVSPKKQCEDLANVMCARSFECFSAVIKSSKEFVAQFGASESECKAKWDSVWCANVTDDRPCADSSKKYNSSKATACVDDWEKASCQTVTGGSFASGNCSSFCQ